VETLIKWIGGLILFVALFYVLFLVVNQKIQDRKLKRSQFKCTYIEGKCSKKPTYENCKQFGSVPDHVCEFKLNRDMKTMESLKSNL
jgi:hypothetical protein